MLEIEIHDFWGNRVRLPTVTLLIGCVILVAFSHFAGKILTRPIIELEKWVEGQRSTLPPDVLTRKDELGHLARSLNDMKTRLEKETKRIQADRDVNAALYRMNSMVLKGGSDPSTITLLLSIIKEEVKADAAFFIRRDPDRGGFKIVSSRSSKIDDGMIIAGGIIPDERIPARLLFRYLDTFEIPFSDMDEEINAWARSSIGDFSKDDRVLVNMPVETEGRYIGSLLLIRRRNGLLLDQIRPFAHQLVGAAKYIETHMEKDRNWTSIMTALSKAVDAKSAWTNGHSDRVARLSTAIGRRLLMDADELNRLLVSAFLHDVGKIAIPESIIDKNGRLSENEMTLMRQHPERGAEIVESLPGYGEIRHTILHHHERWDGRGYPFGISGEQIPLHARIISIADVYDAITSERPYRKGIPGEQALAIIVAESGTAFDPKLVHAFTSAIRESTLINLDYDFSNNFWKV